MMEAIRLSIAAEEDRQRREEKEAKKEEKKKAKEDKKVAKQAEKLAKKQGSSAPLYPVRTNDSTSTWATASMTRSSSNLGAQPTIPEEQIQGKGKAPVQDFAGFNPLSEPTSTLNTEIRDHRSDKSGSPSPSGVPRLPKDDPQGHLEASRANLQPAASIPIPMSSPQSTHLRQLSNASSAASSFVDSAPGSLRADSNMPSGGGSNMDLSGEVYDGTPPLGTTPIPTPGTEPMFNFRSLAAMIGDEDKARSEHIEDAESTSRIEEELKDPSPTGSPRTAPLAAFEGNRSRGDSGESSSSAPPPIYVELPTPGIERDGDLQITPAPAQIVHDPDRKDYGNINVLEHGQVHETTQ